MAGNLLLPANIVSSIRENEMKFASRLVRLAFLTLSFSANATMVDFDNSPLGTIASGTVITNQYSSLGVTFSALDNGNSVGAYAVSQFAALSTGTGHSGNSLWNCNVGCGPRADIIRMTFSAPASGVSWYTDSEGSNPITFNAYDASSNLLQSVTIASDYPEFILTQFGVAGIARIDAIQPDDNWGWSMDNISFTIGSQVPEPASLALLGIGLAGLGAMRRKPKAD